MHLGSRTSGVRRKRSSSNRSARLPCVEYRRESLVAERVEAHPVPIALHELEVARVVRHLPLQTIKVDVSMRSTTDEGEKEKGRY